MSDINVNRAEDTSTVYHFSEDLETGHLSSPSPDLMVNSLHLMP